MAPITAASDGVPPNAAPPSKEETTGAKARVNPATDQSGPIVLKPRSTFGVIVQEPVRRSLPNQVTTSATLRRFGQSSCSASSEAVQSVAAVSW